MKRFTETEKWNDAWFRRLKPELKLLWNYVCDRCDNAGVWAIDWELVEFHTGFKFDAAAALEAFNSQTTDQARVVDIGRARWWVPKFIPFQFGELNPEKSRVHKSVFDLIVRHGLDTLWIAYAKGMPTYPVGSMEPPGKGQGTGKGLEKGSGEKPRPKGIPCTEKEAVEWASMEAVPPEFARDVFHQCEGVDWIDGSNRSITNWRAYIRSRFSRQQKVASATVVNGNHAKDDWRQAL